MKGRKKYENGVNKEMMRVDGVKCSLYGRIYEGYVVSRKLFNIYIGGIVKESSTVNR